MTQCCTKYLLYYVNVFIQKSDVIDYSDVRDVFGAAGKYNNVFEFGRFERAERGTLRIPLKTD